MVDGLNKDILWWLMQALTKIHKFMKIFGSSILLVWFQKCASSASNNSYVCNYCPTMLQLGFGIQALLWWQSVLQWDIEYWIWTSISNDSIHFTFTITTTFQSDHSTLAEFWHASSNWWLKVFRTFVLVTFIRVKFVHLTVHLYWAQLFFQPKIHFYSNFFWNLFLNKIVLGQKFN